MRALVLLVLMTFAANADERVRIGAIDWYTNYEEALTRAEREGKPLWLHFGENPGCAGCVSFANGPLKDPRLVKAAQHFIPVFIDTLNDRRTTRRFHEKVGSYPVLRFQDKRGQDLPGRIDTNPTAGEVSVEAVLEQMERHAR